MGNSLVLSPVSCKFRRQARAGNGPIRVREALFYFNYSLTFNRADDPPSITMENTKHTPGPWTPIATVLSQEATAHHYLGTFFTEFHDENGYTIGYAIREEDARLIAAAPTMLEALESLFNECAMVHKHWGENSNTKAADEAIKRAQEAIKAARG